MFWFLYIQLSVWWWLILEWEFDSCINHSTGVVLAGTSCVFLVVSRNVTYVSTYSPFTTVLWKFTQPLRLFVPAFIFHVPCLSTFSNFSSRQDFQSITAWQSHVIHVQTPLISRRHSRRSQFPSLTTKIYLQAGCQLTAILSVPSRVGCIWCTFLPILLPRHRCFIITHKSPQPSIPLSLANIRPLIDDGRRYPLKPTSNSSPPNLPNLGISPDVSNQTNTWYPLPSFHPIHLCCTSTHSVPSTIPAQSHPFPINSRLLHQSPCFTLN